jgi:uncharacterized damage-inducible protein DinB
MTIDEVRDLFAYDQWANGALIAAIRTISDEEFTRDLGNSFPSIRDTLSHIVAGAWVWLRRWHGESPRALPTWERLDQIESHLAAVEAERLALLDTLSDDDLHRPLTYTNVKGEQWTYALGDMFRHIVNHSTYHRGQLVTMLRQVGARAPSTDFLVFRDQTPAP